MKDPQSYSLNAQYSQRAGSQREDCQPSSHDLRECSPSDGYDRSDWSDQHYAAYQNVNLVAGRKGRVFMVGFGKTGDSDIADIFELKLEQAVPTTRRLQKSGRRIFDCRKTDFRSGSGLAITDSEELLILSCGHREFAIELFEPKLMK